MTKKRQILFSVIRGLLAILIALLVATLLIFLSADGSSFSEKLSATGDALKQLLVGPLFRMGRSGTTFDFKRLTDILASMIPIIFTGLSVCVMFSANQFNLGAEGGIMLGAFTTGMVAVYVPMAAFLHPVVGVLAGGLAVAAIMLLPALLKTKLNVSEMVCSLMLNYIIMYLIKYLMNTYLADKTKGQIQSYEFLETSRIAPLIDNGSKLSWGFVIAIACVVLIGLFMFNTRWGYTIRMIGINQAFAKYSGMKVATVIVLSQVLGGFLAGIGGGIEMLGRYVLLELASRLRLDGHHHCDPRGQQSVVRTVRVVLHGVSHKGLRADGDVCKRTVAADRYHSGRHFPVLRRRAVPVQIPAEAGRQDGAGGACREGCA